MEAIYCFGYVINARTFSDHSFLLRFLRTKKFRISDAQTLLEKYLKMRTEHQDWFGNLDIRNPRLEELIDRGYFFALPERDEFGRRVFFSVAGKEMISLHENSRFFHGFFR